MIELSKEDQINAISLWQKGSHPLLCKLSTLESEHGKLISKCIDGEIYMICPTCHLIKNDIPDIVFTHFKYVCED